MLAQGDCASNVNEMHWGDSIAAIEYELSRELQKRGARSCNSPCFCNSTLTGSPWGKNFDGRPMGTIGTNNRSSGGTGIYNGSNASNDYEHNHLYPEALASKSTGGPFLHNKGGPKHFFMVHHRDSHPHWCESHQGVSHQSNHQGNRTDH